MVIHFGFLRYAHHFVYAVYYTHAYNFRHESPRLPVQDTKNPHTVPFNRIDVSAYHALLPFLVLCHLTLILWGNLILHLIIWGKTTFFYLAKNKQLTQKTSEIGADFMGKTTNYMGNFRAQFPLAILLSDIWFPYLCLPSYSFHLLPSGRLRGGPYFH